MTPKYTTSQLSAISSASSKQYAGWYRNAAGAALGAKTTAGAAAGAGATAPLPAQKTTTVPQKQQQVAELENRRRAGGTLLTGPLGLMGAATTRRKTLLGG
jgi:hypothetical protein